jgi:hypothetical protein
MGVATLLALSTVNMVSAAQMDAGCYDKGEEQEVARAKIFDCISLPRGEIVSAEDDGAFKVEVLFADTPI